MFSPGQVQVMLATVLVPMIKGNMMICKKKKKTTVYGAAPDEIDDRTCWLLESEGTLAGTKLG